MLIKLLNSGLTTEIDEEFKHLSVYRWHVLKKPPSKTFCASATINGKKVTLHRIILNPPNGLKTNHIDGNGLNNKLSNLRVATQSQNMANVGLLKNNTNGFKGISFIPKKSLWRAAITVNGKRPYLGCFKLKEDAARAYDDAAVKFFGPFPQLNFPKKIPEILEK